MSFTIFQNEKTPFQAITTRSSKGRKIDIFPNLVNPWFWSKNGHFSNFSFQAIQARKMSFTIFQNEKTPFQAIKTKSSKSRKIDIFPKGLTHGLVQKWPFFQLLFFWQCRPVKCLLRYSRTKKQKVQRVEKLIFFKGVNPWFWSKHGHFPNFYFLGNISQEKFFYDILE